MPAHLLVKISYIRERPSTLGNERRNGRAAKGGPLKRKGNIWPDLVSDENIRTAIAEVNLTHRWYPRHRANKTVRWVEATLDDRVEDLRMIAEEGYIPSPVKRTTRWDPCAGKDREICEPCLWPDQYIHHMLIQATRPQLMRGMDPFCCGSIRGRGIRLGKESIERWMKKDYKGTRYCMELDIHHFYDSIRPEHVIVRLRHLIKDRRVLELCESVMEEGVLIGLYPSQWFANVLLQPLDRMIRESGYASHYMRYMDNLVIFGPNKRKLRKLKVMIDEWLDGVDLYLNDNHQIYPTRSRRPQALGYRYGHGYTLLRKRNRLRITRQISKYKRKIRRGQKISLKLACSLLSRLGQLKHSCSFYFYQKYYPAGLQKKCKNVVRAYMRRERTIWNISSAAAMTV